MAFILRTASVTFLSLFAVSFLVYCATANIDKTNLPYTEARCYDGIPGRNGKPGHPGAPGRAGHNGAKGGPGKNGTQGPPGTIKGQPGINGMNGAKGKPGAQGPPGQTGQRGIPGMSYKNWKECAWKNLNNDRDYGLIKDCVFTKVSTETNLRVYWNGALRIEGCTKCCKRWYFTFNGTECAAPLPIDGIVYLGAPKTQNPHRVRHIEGHCSNIHKGNVRVGFRVGNCHGYRKANAYTGYISVSRIFIEEVPKPQA